MRKQKPKEKISAFKTILWLIQTAWRARKSVPVLYAMLALLALLQSLGELWIAPIILDKVEQRAAPAELCLTVAALTLLLFFLSTARPYIEKNSKNARFDVRMYLHRAVMEKALGTSYPNTLRPDFQKLKYGCDMAGEEALSTAWDTLSALLASLLGFALYLAILSGLPALPVAAAAVTSVLSFLIARKTDTYRERHQEEAEAYAQKSYYVEYTAQSPELAKDIRVFGLAGWLNDIIRSIHGLYLAFYRRAEAWRLLGGTADALLAMARNGICYAALLSQAMAGTMSAAQFLLYFGAVTGFTAWITEILRQMAQLRGNALQLANLRAFLAYPEPFRFSEGKEIPPAQSWELRLDNVSFRYPEMDADLISHMNLTVHAGEKLAVVGLNGAGKTTLVMLLCGLLEPTEGRVLLNGTDIRAFDRAAYYRLFSVVFQQYSLLGVSLAEEISLDMEHMDRERVKRCLQDAQLWERVCALPQGMDTPTNQRIWPDGVQLSGGENQRLLLARALYRDAPILLLDEPTAALDPLAESELYRRYHGMTAGKTAMFISHRLASTRFCDRVIFLKDGQIAEEGTHDSLLRAGGEYARMYHVQSRYYQEGRDF